MPEPTKGIRKKSTERFYDMGRFPNYTGSIGGKYITLKYPHNTDSRRATNATFEIREKLRDFLINSHPTTACGIEVVVDRGSTKRVSFSV